MKIFLRRNIFQSYTSHIGGGAHAPTFMVMPALVWEGH